VRHIAVEVTSRTLAFLNFELIVERFSGKLRMNQHGSTISTARLAWTLSAILWLFDEHRVTGYDVADKGERAAVGDQSKARICSDLKLVSGFADSRRVAEADVRETARAVQKGDERHPATAHLPVKYRRGKSKRFRRSPPAEEMIPMPSATD
jgi:hypothetical protein